MTGLAAVASCSHQYLWGQSHAGPVGDGNLGVSGSGDRKMQTQPGVLSPEVGASHVDSTGDGAARDPRWPGLSGHLTRAAPNGTCFLDLRSPSSPDPPGGTEHLCRLWGPRGWPAPRDCLRSPNGHMTLAREPVPPPQTHPAWPGHGLADHGGTEGGGGRGSPLLVSAPHS